MTKFKLKPDDIRKMSPEERERLLRELKLKLAVLRYKATAGTLENPGELRETRRNIARILTIINEEKRRQGGR
ncbi:MAG: 50S ribosomal protein L29 [Desulfurococcales archaeon]|nr:50S ribosomal protein L29 [Desulfurococcales archaeon]